jgi:hypothetical protein
VIFDSQELLSHYVSSIAMSLYDCNVDSEGKRAISKRMKRVKMKRMIMNQGSLKWDEVYALHPIVGQRPK